MPLDPASVSSSSILLPPLRGWVKVNFDAYVANGTIRALGIVIRDSFRKILVTGVRRLKARWSVDMSEAAAALFSLEVASRFDFEHIQLEGDSLTMISAINNKKDGFSPVHFLYDSIFALSSNYWGFGCSFVKRDGNLLVHLVARWDTGLANEKICIEPFPQGLQTLADLDLC
ncbi:uncharacterized protein LOC130810728 [Amaranthus tricolor]|uniref:uncharacterized protein LOC130810728 n=1 Tax=Amaranthus tricolor TaxID=29722 RepID=UPI002584F949|nr:uncharacterized protein LOC130810728 [Amaranthus tricolor]